MSALPQFIEPNPKYSKPRLTALADLPRLFSGFTGTTTTGEAHSKVPKGVILACDHSDLGD